MRIKRLDLKAFGPFTDQTLIFHSKDPGLHIIFGRNEAGKSSSLRGLKALLYGFPKQTSDNHIHANAQLLVGGLLERDSGETLDFLRRKKNIAALRDPDDNPIADNALSTFLPGTDAGIFESLYAIDHEVLVQGGKALLAQKGDLGQSLFAAGTGILSLRRILEEFNTEAKQLFSPQASTKPLNKALNQYKTLKKLVKTSSLSSRDWQDHRNRLKKTESLRTALQKKRSEQSLELRRLTRLKQAIPQLKHRESLQKSLSTLGKVRILPEDFSEHVQKLKQKQSETIRQNNRANLRLESRQKEHKTIHLNQGLLDQTPLLPSLERLGAYKKGMQDKPRLDAAYNACQSEARECLRRVQPDLGLEAVEDLRPVLHRKKRVQTLSNSYEALNLQVSASQKNLQKNLREQAQTEQALRQLAPEKEISPLAQSFKLAMRAGELDEQIRINHEAVEIEKKQCSDTFKRIDLFYGAHKDLRTLSLPLPETIKGFEAHFDELNKTQMALNLVDQECKTKLGRLTERLQKMSDSGEIPTESELAAQREKRQQGWQLVQRAWLKKEDIQSEAMQYDPSCSLSEAFEKQIHSADQLADRLRSEADRVARFAELKAESQRFEKKLETNKIETIRLQENLHSAEENWRRLWVKNGIHPLTPKEMLTWLEQIDRLRTRIDALEKNERFLQSQKIHREKLSQALRSNLNQLTTQTISLNELLAPLILSAESVLDDMRRNHQQRKQLEEKKATLKKDQAEYEDAQINATKALQHWQSQWQVALEELQLGEDLSPAEASDILESLQTCFDKLKQAGDFASRIKGIDRDASDYELEVKTLLKNIAPDLLNQSIASAVVQLHNMQEKAKQALVLRQKIQIEIAEITESILLFESELKGFELQMQQYIQEADCENAAGLNEAILKSKDCIRFRDKLSEVEDNLSLLSEGEPLATIIAQAESIQAETLPGKITAITEELAETLEPEILRLSEVIGDERLTFRQMDGSSDAAETAASAQQVLARIARMANEYVRLKLASTLLHEAIERYRSAHQDPLLKLASSYFSRLTMASFSEIRSDLDDKGVAILIGLRPDGTRLPVEAMSTGTRDQLYLALRLSIVQSRLKSNEAIPFIVDDILINFDDDRSRATLGALADLAQKNQVILFTHHQQIVNDAVKVKGLGGIYLHELAAVPQ